MFHISDGWYYVPATTTHTNTLGSLTLMCQATGTIKSLPMWKDFEVVTANVFDSLVSGSDRLDVGTVSSGVWNATVRTLTSGGTISDSVWVETARTLTSAGVTWTAGTRTLTSGGTISDSVWVETARTLTSAAAVWPAGTRRLTSGSTVAGSVWVSSTRTLTSAGTTWTAGTRTLTSGSTVAGSVWVAAARTLTSAATTWTAAARTLTSAAVVWTAGTRSLTDEAGFALTTGQHDAIASRVWVTTARTITSGAAAADSVWARTQAEATGVPTATAAAGARLQFVYMSARNKRVTNATGDKVHNSASVVIAKANLSYVSGTSTFTKGKYATATG